MDHETGPRLRTERLRLEPFTEADTEELLGIFQDPVVRRFLLDGAVVSREWVAREIRASRAAFRSGGAGLWSLRPVERHPAGRVDAGSEAAILGFAGFRRFPEYAPREVQLLYGLRPAAHGRGLATEAAVRVCAYVLEALGWEEVWASVDLPNTASKRVLDRIGMVLERTTDEGEWGTAFYVLRRAGPVGEAGAPGDGGMS